MNKQQYDQKITEQYNFELLVKLLSKLSDEDDSSLDDEIDNFENAILDSGYGESYFGVARSDWDNIEVLPYSKAKFYAEYYDGYQAPFTVCIWNESLRKLEELLKESSPVLYKEYITRITAGRIQ